MAILWLLAGFRPVYSFTGGIVVAMVGWQFDAMLAEHRVQKIRVPTGRCHRPDGGRSAQEPD